MMERNPPKSEANIPGKPCRTCHDFKSWFRQRTLEQKATDTKSKDITLDAETEYNPDVHQCPLDRDTLGRSTWGFLHTMAAYYPDMPTSQQQSEMKNFIAIFSKFYPCEDCAKDFQHRLKRHPPEVSTRHRLSQWFCEAHNHVNRRTGKPEFDCSKVDERWKNGWADGSCG